MFGFQVQLHFSLKNSNHGFPRFARLKDYPIFCSQFQIDLGNLIFDWNFNSDYFCRNFLLLQKWE